MSEAAEGTPSNEIRAEILIAGFVREGDPDGPDPGFVPHAIAQIREHWIDPYLEGKVHDEPRHGLVIMHASSVEVRVNDDAGYLGLVGEDDQLAPPDGVFVGQITSLWPAGVDPDLAWTGYATAEGGRIVVCDLRRNRERVKTLLTRAAEYSRSAELNLAGGLVAPAVEALNTAAELAVMTLIQLEGWDDRRNHHNRREWLSKSVRYSSVPADFEKTVEALAAERNAARYNERPLSIERDQLVELRETVLQMIDYAEARRA